MQTSFCAPPSPTRRLTDSPSGFWSTPGARVISFFHSFRCKVVTVRITATDETRIRRGWHWAAGVDDTESECGWDGIADWDLVIQNDELSEQQLLQKLDPLIRLAAGCSARS